MSSDILYQGNSTITVENLPDFPQPVVIKKPAKPHPSQRSHRTLENEYQMTRALKAVEGVRHVLEQKSIENQPALILEYIEGQTLRDTITAEPLNLRSRLEIAMNLARILGEIHQQNVIHLDLNSQNILIGKDQEALHIIDLGSAAYVDRGGYQKVRPDQLLGTLPYIAPEQTGRINRAVDERSDLYSLGVVLYELMTGQLPFDSKDPMELVHNHIARIPVSPSEISAEIPTVLSDIILNLLSKNAEDRYQSASGVQDDLEKCLQRLSPENTIEGFPLGEVDYTGTFKYPQSLYGRQGELKILEQAFNNAYRQTSSMIFVAGYSGIGKTALVEEIQPKVTEIDGYFVRGKFDQFLRTTPFTAISQAFTEFVSLILTESETSFTQSQGEIQASVGDLGQVLIDMIPALEELIGTQPDVPQLDGQEAENRFNYVFSNFLLAVATEEHPLVLFIDDLQWIDAASLRLLQVIQNELNRPGLLVIGAYRDNEVEASHPLMGIIDQQEGTGIPFQILKLEDLQPQHVETLLSDTLRSSEGIPELGSTVYEKTHGNPFFVRRLLFSLNEEGLFRYDTGTNSWQWDLEDIDSAAITHNVADFLANAVKQLPEEVKYILSLAACIGNRFEISTLALISNNEEQEVTKLLAALLSMQYVVASGDTYEFVHDQVQQAAYGLIDAKDRKKKHLEIGRMLFANTDETELDDRIFDIVSHYNLSAGLLIEQAEKLQAVELNLVAGRKARLAAAFAASAEYLQQGLTLLDKDAWRDHYDLTLDVHCELIKVCNLNIQYEEVEALFEAITENAKQDADAGVAHKVLIMSFVARQELSKAISLAERYLERLGVTLGSERESDLTIAELYDLAPMENREKLVAMEILMAITTPVLLSAPERLPSVNYTMLNLISQYGNNTLSSFAYSWYAQILCLKQQYQEGNRLGQIAVDLLEKYPHPGRAAEIMVTQYANVRHWLQPIHDQINPLKTYHRMAMQAGDFEYGLYCLLNYIWLSWGSGKPLDQCLLEIEPIISLCQSKDQQFTLQLLLMLAQSVLNLTGRSPSTTQLEGKWFSEETMMSRLAGNQYLLSLYGLLKMELCYFFGEPEAAYRQTQDVLKCRDSLNPHYMYTKTSFYGALSCIADLPNGENDADRQERLGNLRLFEEELKLWAEVNPINYQHQYDLVIAEKCRISDKHWKAVQFYEQAIRGSQEIKFLQDEALANELYGQFWLDRGNDKIAEMYMREAHALYHQWGAYAKVDHLEKCCPKWFQTESIPIRKPDVPNGAGEVHTTITQPVTPIQLDMESIISASQILSAETDLEQLLTKLITLVMANSGAEKAVLLLKQENDWFVQARGDSASEKYDVLLNQPFDPADREIDHRESGLIPEPVFNYCRRTETVLVVGDVKLDGRFAKDRMIREHKVQSMACIPILSQGELRAMLYLESRQMADVFTLENVSILKHLSTQFGVSVENALLYDNLNQLVEERTVHLQKSEREYRNLVEKVSDVIYRVDVNGTITFVNAAVETLLGLTPEQVIGGRIDQYIHPDDLGQMQENTQHLLSGVAPGSSEYRAVTHAGEMRWIHVTSQPILDGDQVTGIQGLLTDITDRKKMEKRLEEAATAAERQRLARDLHDSVTQVLFSASLVADVLPNIWRRDPDLALESVQELRRLTRSALAEMRTMLLELRPLALIKTPLDDLLVQLTEAITSREDLTHQLIIEKIPPLPEKVHTSFYRIAQEGLNNVVKHAQANMVRVSLNATTDGSKKRDQWSGEVKLGIKDDGLGFSPQDVYSEQMGISIIRERAASINAKVSINSQPGQGTELTLVWHN